jgi:hypothetical protein
MAQQIKIQDGIVVYTSPDPLSTDMDFTVRGLVNVTKEVNVGDDPLANGSITTPVDTDLEVSVTGIGKIKLITDLTGGVLINNVQWPDGTVIPVPGMYLGVSALNTLQFLTMPAQQPPAYQILVSLAAQVIFNTSISTVANGGGIAYLQVFVDGVKQIEGASNDYQVTGPTQITFNAGQALNANVEFYSFA